MLTKKTATMIAILVFGVLFILSFSAGCTVKAGDTIDCSSAKLITDVYKSPSGPWVVADGQKYRVEDRVDGVIGDPREGQFIVRDKGITGRWYPVYLKQLNESEYGMRDACLVIGGPS